MLATETDAAEETPMSAGGDATADEAVEDKATEDGPGDAIPQNLLTGAALYVVQPQQQPPSDDGVATEASTGAAPPLMPDMPADPGIDAGEAADAAQAAAAVQTAATQGTAAQSTAKTSTATAMPEMLTALGAGTSDVAAAEDEASAPPTVSSERSPSNASAARTGNSAVSADAGPATAASSPAPNTASAARPASGEDAATPAPTSPAEPSPAALTDLASARTGPDALLSTSQSQAAPSTQAAAPVVQTSLSSLSRATIETTAQIAAQITRRLEGRATRFEMALTPDDLGRVDVSLDIDADGQLVARLAFDNPLAATELRGRADELRSQLEDAGFTLAHDALDFSQRDASSGGGFDRRQNRAFASASRMAAEADAAHAQPAAWVSLNLTPRGVDMKV